MTPPSILIVEDDANVAELLGFMFSRAGFAPKLLRDGRAAEEYVTLNEPTAAVVLDVMLPYRDGFSVATLLRSDVRWKDVPLVMLTARASGEDHERGRQLGIDEYVVKPFHPNVLVQCVKILLGRGDG